MQHLSLISKFILVLLISFTFNFITFAGNNLPQTNLKVVIKGKDHKYLKKYFEGIEEPVPSIDTTTEKLLIKLFPKPYDKACKDMISTWGKKAKGTASKALRVAFMKNYSKKFQQVFVALTCFSNAPAFGDKFYDERLALLSIDSDSSILTMLPNAEPCEQCSDLTHIGLNDDYLIGGKTTVSFLFASSTKNPSYQGNIQKEEVTEKYYLLDPPNAKDIFTVTRKKTETFHRETALDSVVIYESDCNYQKDANENINQIDVDFTLTVNNADVKSGLKSYVWNKKMKIFENRR